MTTPTQEETIERVARAIAKLRICNLEYGQFVECASCRNGMGYNDDVGCITLAKAALSAMPDNELMGEVKAAYLEGCSAGRYPHPDDEEAYEMLWEKSDAMANARALLPVMAEVREALEFYRDQDDQAHSFLAGFSADSVDETSRARKALAKLDAIGDGL